MTASSFISSFPDANDEQGATYQLSLAELASLPVPFKINHAEALFAITAAGLATWIRNKSIVKNITRHTVRRLLSSGKPSQAGIRYVDANSFIKLFPKAISAPGSTYQLSNSELSRLDNH
jgi:hypothetical protein